MHTVKMARLLITLNKKQPQQGHLLLVQSKKTKDCLNFYPQISLFDWMGFFSHFYQIGVHLGDLNRSSELQLK